MKKSDEGDFLLTVRDSIHGSVVAVCDAELHGLIFEENDVVLDLRGSFFYDEGLTLNTADVRRIVEEINRAYTSNIVGNRIVGKLVKQGVLSPNNLREVAGIKYAMTFRIK